MRLHDAGEAKNSLGVALNLLDHGGELGSWDAVQVSDPGVNPQFRQGRQHVRGGLQGDEGLRPLRCGREGQEVGMGVAGEAIEGPHRRHAEVTQRQHRHREATRDGEDAEEEVDRVQGDQQRLSDREEAIQVDVAGALGWGRRLPRGQGGQAVEGVVSSGDRLMPVGWGEGIGVLGGEGKSPGSNGLVDDGAVWREIGGG